MRGGATERGSPFRLPAGRGLGKRGGVRAMSFQTYQPPGATVAQLLSSPALVRVIMGPEGSGKTGGCLMDNVYGTMGQEPHPAKYELDRGEKLYLRFAKRAVIRSTTRDLERTTIPSWLRWVPKGLGHWTGGSGGVPATHTLIWNMGDGTAAHLVMEFFGLGDKKPDEAMPGWEGSGAYLNEVNLLSPDVLMFMRSRSRRFPPREAGIGFGGLTRQRIVADCNAFDDQHWCYKMFVENPPADLAFFRQPGAVSRQPGGGYAVNPQAENIQNLPENFYQDLWVGQPDWWIRAKLMNEFVGARDGDPVYGEWVEAQHLAQYDLAPIPGLPLLVGGDAGLHGAVVIAQLSHWGQVRVLDEVIAPEGGMGAEAFGKMVNAVLRERYAGYSVDWGSYDPAGNQRGATDERSWAMVMQAVTGFSWRPAETNKPGIRQQAVRGALLRPVVIDGKPAFGLLVSRRCTKLVRGFNGAYRLKRSRDAQGNIIAEADKNHPYSDVHDGLQYLCMGLGEHRLVIERHRRADAQPRQIRAEDDTHDAVYERRMPPRFGVGANGGPPLAGDDPRRGQRQDFADES